MSHSHSNTYDKENLLGTVPDSHEDGLISHQYPNYPGMYDPRHYPYLNPILTQTDMGRGGAQSSSQVPKYNSSISYEQLPAYTLGSEANLRYMDHGAFPPTLSASRHPSPPMMPVA